MRLSDILQSKAQVKLLEYLIENRGKVFNQAGLASMLHVSPSTVARVIEPLVKHNILRYERFGKGMKILTLNIEDAKTQALVEACIKLNSLQ
ncbi:MAG: hypothetical protein QW390_00455 [Candidatus Bathyarchaeia archaeon]